MFCFFNFYKGIRDVVFGGNLFGGRVIWLGFKYEGDGNFSFCLGLSLFRKGGSRYFYKDYVLIIDFISF